MIQLSGAGKRFGHKLLFENADWLITPNDRVGLVGANGTGKSTLMKVLAGLDALDYGTLTIAKGTTAGYLPQDGLSLSGRTVFAECMSVFDELRAMEQELETLTHSMAELDHTGPEYAAVADRYHTLEHEFRTRDGHQPVVVELQLRSDQRHLEGRLVGIISRQRVCETMRAGIHGAGDGHTARLKPPPAPVLNRRQHPRLDDVQPAHVSDWLPTAHRTGRDRSDRTERRRRQANLALLDLGRPEPNPPAADGF